MTVKAPEPPPLPAELDRLLRRLRLPYVRWAAPEVIATAASQRWEHAEVLKVLLAEEAAGRDHATTSMRRRSSGLPAGKRSTRGNRTSQRSRNPPSTPCARWNGSTVTRCCACADRPGPANRIS